MNGVTKDVNKMNRVRKEVTTVKEIDNKEKIKLVFSGIVARRDINWIWNLNSNLFILIKAIQVKYNLVTHHKEMHQTSKVDRQNAKFHLLKSYIVCAHINKSKIFMEVINQ